MCTFGCDSRAASELLSLDAGGPRTASLCNSKHLPSNPLRCERSPDEHTYEAGTARCAVVCPRWLALQSVADKLALQFTDTTRLSVNCHPVPGDWSAHFPALRSSIPVNGECSGSSEQVAEFVMNATRSLHTAWGWPEARQGRQCSHPFCSRLAMCAAARCASVCGHWL